MYGVLLCTGKIFYELQSRRGAKERSGVALVRIEQLYPYPKKQLDRILAQYPKAQIAWVQEEPENMGALQFIQRMNNGKLGLVFSRKASASPATGYHKIHDSEQEEIITQSLSV
jgi:2-oxoglutarate dehydrogenase E1 component